MPSVGFLLASVGMVLIVMQVDVVDFRAMITLTVPLDDALPRDGAQAGRTECFPSLLLD